MVVTAIAVGGGIYFWQQSMFVADVVESTVESEPCQEVGELERKVAELTDDLFILNDLLTVEMVRSAVLSSFGDGYVFRWPKETVDWVGFAFTSSEGERDAFNVGRYDGNTDTDRREDEGINLYPGETFDYVFEEELSADRRIHIVGLDENRLVLWETGIDNSPGPCFDPWLAEGLTYLDLDKEPLIRKPYQASQSILDEVQSEVDQCLAGPNH